jgi:agmatinase
VLILGVPLEATTTFRAGTREGPTAIREASWHLEDYELLDGRDILEVPFSDLGDLELSASLQDSLALIEEATGELARQGKAPLLLGGEHLITWPAVKALQEGHPQGLHLVAFDAHLDMAPGPPGHASVLRFVAELLGPERVFLFGVRSGSRPEAAYVAERGILHSPTLPGRELLERLQGQPLYISLDMDCLRPWEAPGVSNPEPAGGLDAQGLLESLRALAQRAHIVGADLVELCPPYDPGGITALLGARLLRELLHCMGGSRR